MDKPIIILKLDLSQAGIWYSNYKSADKKVKQFFKIAISAADSRFYKLKSKKP